MRAALRLFVAARPQAPLGAGLAFAHKYKGDGGVCLMPFARFVDAHRSARLSHHHYLAAPLLPSAADGGNAGRRRRWMPLPRCKASANINNTSAYRNTWVFWALVKCSFPPLTLVPA